MRFFRVSFVKDVQRYLHDPAAILLSVLIPLIIGILLKLVSGGDGQLPTAKLLIADHDDSLVSGLLAGAFSQGPLKDMVTAENVSEANGRERMDEGEASGFLIIPENFGSDVLSREPTVLTLITNPSQRILPGILSESLNTFADGINGIHQVMGNSVDPLLDELATSETTPPDRVVSELSVAVNQVARRVEPYLFPPVIKVKTAYIEEEHEDRSFAELFFPSMFFLAIIFTAQSLSDDVWKEKLRGTLRRTVSTPGRLWLFLLAKVLAGGVVVGIVSVVALVIGRWVLFMPFSNLPLAVLWSTVSGIFMLLLFTVVQLLASSQRGGNMLSSALLFPLVMAGGAFFPFEAMPDWMARIGRVTPNGWALERLKDILNGTVQADALVAAALGILAVGLVFFVFSLNRLTSFASN